MLTDDFLFHDTRRDEETDAGFAECHLQGGIFGFGDDARADVVLDAPLLERAAKGAAFRRQDEWRTIERRREVRTVFGRERGRTEDGHAAVTKRVIERAHSQRRRDWGVGEDEVECVDREIGHEPVGRPVAHDHAHGVVQGKRGLEQTSHDELGELVGDADDEAHGSAGGAALQGLLKLASQAEDLLGVPVRDGSHLREHQVAPGPLEQALPDGPLQRADLSAHRRLREAQLARGTGHRPLTRHHPEVEQMVVIELMHRENLSNAPVPRRHGSVAFGVALLPLIGHESLRERLNEALTRGTLPASLLFYGPPGIGKERLALWLGTRILCETPTADGEPCGTCQHCTYAARGAHPDLHWYFPRPRGRDSDPPADDVLADFAEAIADRLKQKGPWEPVAAMDGIFVATVRAIVTRAAFTPALAKRKVIVIADVDRMVSQEGSDQAANAFLKLLEEPPANATIILTTSARNALLPTIRSRVASVRVAPPSREAAAALAQAGIEVAIPGDNARARALLDAATGSDIDRYRAALAQGARGARGGFSEALDALVVLLHERAREAADRGDDARAAGAAQGVAIVEQTRRIAYQNVNPQALAARLLRDLSPLLS